MMSVRNSNHLTLTGWPALALLVTIALTRALTILVMSLPIAWLVNRVFAASAIHAICGTDHFSGWRCVGVFAIWFMARFKIKFSGPSPSEKEGNVKDRRR
ncbi:MAG: hypothetical protein ACLGPM_09690 [Acidobacteriota bacterium]